MQDQFFFCYSFDLHKYIQRHNIKYVCAALHENTHNKFWLYMRTDELKKVLNLYKGI
jgi:hypothetical protein